jgi:superfamily II helicase
MRIGALERAALQILANAQTIGANALRAHLRDAGWRGDQVRKMVPRLESKGLVELDLGVASITPKGEVVAARKWRGKPDERIDLAVAAFTP